MRAIAPRIDVSATSGVLQFSLRCARTRWRSLSSCCRARENAGVAIAQVARLAGDARLQPTRVRAVAQHLVVVVGLEDEDVERLTRLGDRARDVADVVEQPGARTGRAARRSRSRPIAVASCGSRVVDDRHSRKIDRLPGREPLHVGLGELRRASRCRASRTRPSPSAWPRCAAPFT